MASREEYNACMSPFITGKKPPEQRKTDFCVGAKVCSGKAKTKEEAVAICNLPKPPKPPKQPGSKRSRAATTGGSVEEITTCLLGKINYRHLFPQGGDTNLFPENFEKELREGIRVCIGKSKSKPAAPATMTDDDKLALDIIKARKPPQD